MKTAITVWTPTRTHPLSRKGFFYTIAAWHVARGLCSILCADRSSSHSSLGHTNQARPTLDRHLHDPRAVPLLHQVPAVTPSTRSHTKYPQSHQIP
eukprot:1291712-Pleurochrysis_carterae.AAC.6